MYNRVVVGFFMMLAVWYAVCGMRYAVLLNLNEDPVQVSSVLFLRATGLLTSQKWLKKIPLFRHLAQKQETTIIGFVYLVKLTSQHGLFLTQI